MANKSLIIGVNKRCEKALEFMHKKPDGFYSTNDIASALNITWKQAMITRNWLVSSGHLQELIGFKGVKTLALKKVEPWTYVDFVDKRPGEDVVYPDLSNALAAFMGYAVKPAKEGTKHFTADDEDSEQAVKQREIMRFHKVKHRHTGIASNHSVLEMAA